MKTKRPEFMDTEQQTAEQVKQIFLNGDIPSALQQAEQHLQTYPQNTVLLKVKAYCFMEQKRYREAVVQFHTLDALISQQTSKDDPAIKANLGTCYFFIGFYDKAADFFKQAIKINYQPDWAVNLANCYAELGLYELAILTLQRASGVGFKEPKLHELFIRCLKDAGRFAHAMQVINALPVTDKNSIHLKALQQAEVLIALNQPEKTETVLAQYIESDEPGSEVLQRLHNVYRALGNKTKELEVARKLAEAEPSRAILANCMLAADSQIDESPETVLDNLQSSSLTKDGLTKDGITNDEKARCLFILAKAFKQNDAKQWFNLTNQANQLQNTQPADMKLYKQLFTLIQESSADIPALQLSDIPEVNNLPTPVFVLGMPRSGTTLVETLLGNHSSVFAAGESPLLDSITASIHASIPEIINAHAIRTWYLRDNSKFTPAILGQVAKSYLSNLSQYRSNEAFITDKMPHNFLHLGLILKIFPHAKVILCERDPLSNCISIFEQNFSHFHDYGRDLNTLGDYYLQYHQLMNFFKASDDANAIGNSAGNKILTVQYEKVVANPVEEMARIQSFIGVPAENITEKEQQQRRTILTSSNEQATQGVYTSSLNREQGLEAEFAPLKTKLASLYH